MPVRTTLLRTVAVLAALVVASPTLAADRVRGSASGGRHRLRFGHSVRGRPLVAVRQGDASARRTVLVVGQIHGNEPAGRDVIRALRHLHRDFGRVAVWTVIGVNPDGNRLGTRKNADGVDLNRNFSYRWSHAEPPSSGYYGGPEPFSEPETRAVRRLANRIHPDLTIWYHQPWNGVLACGGGHPIESRYAQVARMRVLCRGEGLPGTATSWEEHRFGGTAFVVEFGAGPLTHSAAVRNARAAAHVAVHGQH